MGDLLKSWIFFTALMIFLALLICRPARRFAQGQRVGDAA